MFMNDRKTLDHQVNEHAKGETFTPCELEIMMIKEAHQHIKDSFDHIGG